MDLNDVFKFITEDLPKILQAALMVIGGLKIIARYTPWAWDDRVFDMIEKPLQMFKKSEEPKE